ncbi:MAG: 1-deoxy-D-xylulose-5-phosphate synthase [Christensenellales bacterium]|jgi:1-deoxy-D-xylulose-5-phosphate synthase
MAGKLENISIEKLKCMSIEEIYKLAKEMREFIIKSVTKTGGHLASNLGVVELTLALHYVFDSPNDKIIFDVGHQSYAHKILTGRKDCFDTLRQYNGVCGFPKPSESEHDAFATGHSSTAVSAALGMARARDIEGGTNEVIAVVGDGAMTGGMAFEAINDAGAGDTRLIVVLNDNEMSISKNVGGFSKHLSKVRTRPGYRRFKRIVEKVLRRLPFIGNWLADRVEGLKNRIKYFLLPKVIFEEYGFTYLGPLDGHDLNELTRAFRDAKQIDKPVLIHAVTKKGKGFSLAELNPEKYHGISPFLVEPPEESDKETEKEEDTNKVFADTLMELAKKDDRIIAITAAMCKGTGLDGFMTAYPDRFFDVGIAEQHAITMAAGMAKAGMRPVAAIYSTFLQRAVDQILHDVCMQKLPVTIAVPRAGIVGADGETHHGIFDISLLRSMPDITIMSPSCDDELRKMLRMSFSLGGPCVIRYPRGVFRRYEGGGKGEEIEFGKWSCVRDGNDIAIIATGRLVYNAVIAAGYLSERGISAEVINARFIKPLDSGMLFDIVKRHSYIVTVEDHVIQGGFGAACLEAYANMGVMPRNFRMYGFKDEFVQHGKTSMLFDDAGLSPEKLACGIASFLEEGHE